MGKKVAEKKKKKKGRPSLLDLQKRNLREQQQQEKHQSKHHQKRNFNPNPNPNSSLNSHRRLTRRNPNPDGNSERNEGEEEDDDDSSGKRREKKLKLVLRLPPRPENSPPGSSPAHHHQLRSSRGGSDFGSYGSDSNGEDEETPLKKRKIDGSALSDSDFASKALEKAERHNSAKKATNTPPGVPSDSGPLTPLPDEKLLVFILDQLQKKDTYGVFSEPVDPKELPDYHEVIEHPMDFSTLRKKLSSGAYANLEQFEKDVFLISSNAMRYNAPDTIYFRQARSIHELARKNFDNLRQDSEDNEPELKSARRGRPPGKSSIKRPLGRPPLERASSDFSSDATLATPGDNHLWSNSTQDHLRKAHDKVGISDISTRNSHGPRNGETFGWLAEHKSDINDDFPGSVLKGLSKFGKKQFVFDENRRSTYKQPHPSVSGREQTVLTAFDGPNKQLISVGLHMEHSYARSLARFAAKLGPVAWKIASKKIEKALPPGTKFGPGWVGENEMPRLQPPLLSSSPPPLPPLPPSQSSSQPRISPSTTIPRALESKGDKLSEKQEPSNNSTLENSSRNPPPPFTATSSVADRSSDTTHGFETIRGTNCNSGFSFPTKPHFQLNQNPSIHSTLNGFNNGFGFNLASQVAKLIQPSMAAGNFSSEASTPSRMIEMGPRRNNTIHSMTTNGLEPEGAKLLGCSNSIHSGSSFPDSGHGSQMGSGPGLNSQPSWRGLSLNPKSDSVPPDLNVRFQSPGSPVSGGLVDSQQPDLALQL
ncbi:uncharacterized protein LOC143854704 [Tasmannia lanceolata]|uniref:uncharacterized protein LOC143854704 n=1 Tax=Tasmannia lanceolata TaxID=3420 RepID=UPI004063F417